LIVWGPPDVYRSDGGGTGSCMSLRGAPLEQSATLPGGRVVTVRVGVPADSYVARSQLDTVIVELFEHERGIAAATTLLEPKQTSEALRLLRRLVTGLEDGSVEPSAAAVEGIVDDPQGW
jgi:hypothetical protein